MDTMKKFSASSNDAVKAFGETFVNEYSNIFDSVTENLKRESQHLIQTNAKATTSKILSTDRQV